MFLNFVRNSNMATKICFKCNVEKELSEFYKHPKMYDGYLNKCKTCNKKDTAENIELKKLDPDWVEKEKTRGREKYHRLGNKKPTYEGKKKANDNYAEKFPEKIKARNYVSNMKTEIQGNQLHHWSYNEEHYKDVIELSVREHKKAHRFLIYDQERFMYRRFDTNELLDTKQKHLEFIMWCIETKED